MEEKIFFYKLLLEGHFGFCHEDCGLKEYSKMSLTELIEKTRAMSPAEIKAIISKHKECLDNCWHKIAS